MLIVFETQHFTNRQTAWLLKRLFADSSIVSHIILRKIKNSLVYKVLLALSSLNYTDCYMYQ